MYFLYFVKLSFHPRHGKILINWKPITHKVTTEFVFRGTWEGASMACKFHPIDRAALSAYLPRHPHSPTGVILRLAWLQGLSREEICALTWESVDFSAPALVLPQRTMPLDADMLSCLQKRWELYRDRSPYVVLSDRSKTPLTPESVSRLARLAFAELGRPEWKLMDLRHDFILRQIGEHGWPYAARVSGMSAAALQSTFGKCAPRPAALPQKDKQPLDEFALWKVMQSERTTPAGLALWLTWQLDLEEREIIALTWDQVDLTGGTLRLADRTLTLTNALWRILEDVRAARAPDADPHVLLTPNALTPLDAAYLSRLVRTALIRGGMEDVKLRDLHRGLREDEETALLHFVQRRRSVTKRETAELLNVSEKAAYSRLKSLVERRKLTRVGARYYIAGSVVAPEDQAQAVCSYLDDVGFAYRQDIAKVLKVEDRQCTTILRQLVNEGRLEQKDRKYFLPREV